jgi:hypothetical protein
MKTAQRRGRLEVSLMKPRISAVLEAFNHWECLMIRPEIDLVRILVQTARPDENTA